ncbi:MAG: ATP-binding cassette domain-containing protein [Holosporales bacterium]|jgi:ATP-binding cassette subfamily B protein|nr:ATP-binding cassette domain-containing protein [Holosporales bacterium]
MIAFGYVLSVLLLPLCVFGFYHDFFLTINDAAISFYLRSAAVFLGGASFVLCWYYANISIRCKSISFLRDFNESIIRSDPRRISTDGIMGIANDNLAKLLLLEDYRFELFGFAIPFLTIFLALLTLACFIDANVIFPTLITMTIATIIIKAATQIISSCDIRKYKLQMDEFMESTAFAAKGIQYYGAEQSMLDQFDDRRSSILDHTKNDITSVTWKMLWCLCGLECCCLLAYIINEEMAISKMFNITATRSFFFAIIFDYTMFLVSILRYIKIRNIKLKNLDQYKFEDTDEVPEKSIVPNSENLFLAFHGVYFQDMAEAAGDTGLQNVSFSVLPGEFISITGENIKLAPYIFDLLLKYYKPQSGNIYISGTSIHSIKKQSIRANVGIFQQDFGLMDGTIYQNLEMLHRDEEKILQVAEKIGLYSILDLDVLDPETRQIQVPQSVLFKLQIARISMQQPRILLIDTPKGFETEEDAQAFEEYVEYMTKRKTVLIITTSPKFIIYSNKILYLGDGVQSLFGSHAQLSQDPEYQKYIKMLYPRNSINT